MTMRQETKIYPAMNTPREYSQPSISVGFASVDLEG